MAKKSEAEKSETMRARSKGYYFSIVCHKPELWPTIINSMKEFKQYYYIKHKPDSDCGSDHYHFLVCCNGTRSIKQISDMCGQDTNFIQVINRPVSQKRYLIHLDDPDKIQYSIDDVITNSYDSLKSAIEGFDSSPSLYRTYNDLSNLRKGIISIDDFIGSHYSQIMNLSFINQLKLIDFLERNANYSERSVKLTNISSL